MSKISDFAVQMAEYQTRMETAIGGIKGDIAGLNESITKLQASQGELTAEQQALLDDVASKSKALAESLEVLDAETPPAAPTAPATE